VTAARWQRVKEIVGDALEVERGRRDAFVDQVCGEDADLRQEVLALLQADDSDAPFLDLDRAPERLGAWRIVKEIGRGGMGTVYLAERADGQFEQRAAIKVIKRGMDTDAVLRRFYAERQILARLQHPNITRLLDGGVFDGRPYFVMEYLDGEPIFEYCRRMNPSLKERIRLFLAVCDAVDYAHRNLILHRDLKGGNILVDAQGAVKLLDFGIAKLLRAEGAADQTMVPMQAFTPQAASPEQVKGEPLTTASDVYALGLLLYELLAGNPAYRVQAHAPVEMAAVICERPVVRPSAVAGTGIARQLRGDLDNIILKALEKDPARRYNRASDMATDLGRYLDGLPVHARPGGAAYRAGKFLSRNRRVVSVAAVLVLAVGVAAVDAIREGRRAARRFAELRQLAGNFLFEFHDAIAALPGSTPARELVEKRALQYLDILSRESAGDLDLKRELAEGYVRMGAAQGLIYEPNLGNAPAARTSLEKGVGLLEEVERARPHDAVVTADLARARLALLSATVTSVDAGQHLAGLQQVAAMLEASARTQPLTAQAQLTLAQAYFGIAEAQWSAGKDAESLRARLHSTEILQDLVRRFPADAEGARWLAQSEKRLARFYATRMHEPAKAAELLRETVSVDRQRLARDPANVVVKLDLALDQDYLGTALWDQGECGEAVQLVEGAAGTRTAILDADPQNYRVRFLLVADYVKLAKWMRELGQAHEASSVVEKARVTARGLDARQARDPEAAALVLELADLR
jgi:tRNA A-37 threonylcarbamoyl transferase component Bud32